MFASPLVLAATSVRMMRYNPMFACICKTDTALCILPATLVFQSDVQSAMPHVLAPQDRLGRYEVVRLLGEGGSGQVYEALLHGPAGFRKRVALKVLRKADRAQAEGGLAREARLGGLLRHPNLVEVFEGHAAVPNLEEQVKWFDHLIAAHFSYNGAHARLGFQQTFGH